MADLHLGLRSRRSPAVLANQGSAQPIAFEEGSAWATFLTGITGKTDLTFHPARLFQAFDLSVQEPGTFPVDRPLQPRSRARDRLSLRRTTASDGRASDSGSACRLRCSACACDRALRFQTFCIVCVRAILSSRSDLF